MSKIVGGATKEIENIKSECLQDFSLRTRTWHQRELLHESKAVEDIKKGDLKTIKEHRCLSFSGN